MQKFATVIDARVLKELRHYAKSADRTIGKIVTAAIAEHLQRVRIRPAFRQAINQVLEEHEELLRRLAQ